MSPSRTMPNSPTLFQLLSDDLRWQIITILTLSDYRVAELTKKLKKPTNLVSYHLKRLSAAHLVRERRSSADARDIYYSLDLDRLHEMYWTSAARLHPVFNEIKPAQAVTASDTVGKRPRVLFLCTHNSARSQMAEGLMRSLSQGRVDAFSAGTEVTRVHPDAIRVMSALGIDLREQRSKSLSEFQGQKFDYVVTVCDRARESCPLFPSDPVRIHWSFPDPAAVEDPQERERAFDLTASQLSRRIQYLLALIENETKSSKD